jgi:predicted peptidase
LCEVNYNILTQSNGINTGIASAARDIIENNNNGVRSILDFLTQDKIATLTAENQALRLTASQQAQNAFLIDQLGSKAPIPAYVVANPYATYGGCGCGTGTCCG